MTTIVGRNCKIEVALTFAAAAAITAMTKANPGVATKTSHGIVDGTVGYFSVAAGMVELHEQAVMTAAAATNTFNLAGLDTTQYSTWTAGDFIAGATWGLLDESAGYSMGGGAADQLDDSRIHLGKRINVAGLNPAEDITVNLRPPEVEGAALAFLTRAARNGTKVLIKITKDSRILRVAYGTPSTYGEQVDVGGLGSGSFNIVCPAWVLKPNV